MIINELPCGNALRENKLRGEKIFMSMENKLFRQLGGDVPDKLIEDFDEMTTRLGFVKKRALAAAASAMIQADLETQHNRMNASSGSGKNLPGFASSRNCLTVWTPLERAGSGMSCDHTARFRRPRPVTPCRS